MSTSLPSREIYVVDVPEINDLEARFQYNFFVPDESVSETSGIPQKLLTRNSEVDSTGFLQFATTRAPRFVVFNWTQPHLADVGNTVSDSQARNHSLESTRGSSLIADNLGKIISEDHFSAFDFASVSFHDGEIDDKIFAFVSGTLEQLSLDQPHDSDVSHSKASAQLQALLPNSIKPHFIFAALTNPGRSTGTQFYKDAATGGAGGKLLLNQYFKRLQSVMVNAQINGKLFHDIVNRNINDPNSPFSSDMQSLHSYSKKIDKSVKHKLSSAISEQEFKTFVPFVDLKVRRTAHQAEHKGAKIVGYVIDKYEVQANGSTVEHPPVVIDNPRVGLALDFRVKYNSSYAYSMRVISQFTIPAIDYDTGEVATIKVLVSSKPSNKVYVTALETQAPPVPSDVNFTWNYETDKLLVHWTFPPNSQRDIKKFQVFRRKDTTTPFELLKMYDFDDSVVKSPIAEYASPRLVEHLDTPCTYYVDDDFDRLNGSKYIYSVCSIDAHGMTSGYSAQYEISFDLFKNKIVKKLVSHSGAPKPYPNMYLEADAFVDTIKVSGPHSKRAKLYFNPQFYQLEDDQGNITKVVTTKQVGGSYKLQFINVDNQKSQIVNITIDDQIKPIAPKIAYTEQSKKQKSTGQ